MIEIEDKNILRLIRASSLSSTQAFLLHGSSRSNIAYAAKLLSEMLHSSNSNSDKYNDAYIFPNERNVITKQDIKELLIKLKTKQTTNKRVIIVQSAHLMSESASNALLKELEEPGDNTIFILCTTKMYLLPKTVISRMHRVIVPIQDLDSLIKICESKGISKEESNLLIAATRGNIEHINLLLDDQDLRNNLLDSVRVAKKILSSDTFSRLIEIKKISKDKLALEKLISVLLALSQSALHATSLRPSKVNQWGNRINLLQSAREKLESNVGPRLIAQLLMVQL